jgi:AraC-like DNA-binding protein
MEVDHEEDAASNMRGWGLFFHPDFIRSSILVEKMKQYTFFSYEMTEALHLSEKEKRILSDIIQEIQKELQENIDDHSQHILAAQVELFLNYCARFYSRQMITRRQSHQPILARVEKLLQAYFDTDATGNQPLPTVKYLADQVHLSPGYLSDLLKKETGKNAQEIIHIAVIEAAKNRLVNSSKSVSEIAYLLGFEYPQYFTRLFKQKTGHTPVEYRSSYLS